MAKPTSTQTELEDLAQLKQRFEAHMDQHRLDEVEYNDRQLRQDIAHQQTMEAIDKLTLAVQPLVDGITMLVVAQKLIKWASGFAFLGVVILFFTGNNPFK